MHVYTHCTYKYTGERDVLALWINCHSGLINIVGLSSDDCTGQSHGVMLYTKLGDERELFYS